MGRRGVTALVAVVFLAGCGDEGGSSASEDYANSVCGAMSAWVTDVNGAITTLTDAGLATNKEDLQAAIDQTKDATDELVSDFRGLGPPETDAGGQAKSELEALGATLRQQVETVDEALESDAGAVALSATVTASLSTAASAVESTYNEIRGLDPGGELADAFENADECESLRDQIEEIRT